MIENHIIQIDRDKMDAENFLLLDELFKNKNNLRISGDIIKVNIPIVLRVVSSFGIKKNSNLYDDFVAEGLYALYYAIRKYDKKKGKFATWAFVIVRYKLLSVFDKYKNCVRLPKDKYCQLRKLIKDSFVEGREYNKDEEELFKLNFRYISEDDVPEDNPNSDLFHDVEKNKEITQVYDKKQYAKDWYDMLFPILQRLSNIEQIVINKTFGLDQEPKSTKDISNHIGISTSRVFQIKNAALRKIKIMMVAKKLIIEKIDQFGFYFNEMNDMV